jgi:hypothetical protein
MVASGVAAVSAYEAHVVNVTAHVENALLLRSGQTTDAQVPLSIDFGTVFPQEWRKAHFDIEMSSSFNATAEVDNITYELWAEWKKIPADKLATVVCSENINNVEYYCWLGDALWVGSGAGPLDYPNDVVGDPTVTDPNPAECPDGTALSAGTLALVGDPPTAPAMAKKIVGAGGMLSKPINKKVTIGVGLDVPVFGGFYNPDTDICPKPSHRDSPTLEIDASDTGPRGRYHPDGVDLGIDLKVQVVDIGRH